VPDYTTPSDSGQKENSAVNIQFEHIATGHKVEFFAWITDFSDAYTSNWNSQELYGRMDPMMTFKNTTRKITLAWDVVAASMREAKDNMAKISRFIQMQYPTYAVGKGSKGGGGAAMIGSPPLIRAKFLNWVGNALNGRGLVCALAGVTFKPNLDHGTFSEGSKLYPQSFALSIDMTILHEHNLGYSAVPGAAHNPKGTFGATKFGGEASNYIGPSNFPYDAPPLVENQLPSPPAAGIREGTGATAPSDEQANEDAVTGNPRRRRSPFSRD
tara:strand:- start:167 stop:979 length:813 start_codon:yes stop_codon:yes gene_type:complete